MTTRQEFAEAIQYDLGATGRDPSGLVAWQLKTGSDAPYNPYGLRAEQVFGEGAPGLVEFPTMAAGVAATVERLRSGEFPATLHAIAGAVPSSWLDEDVEAELAAWGSGAPSKADLSKADKAAGETLPGTPESPPESPESPAAGPQYRTGVQEPEEAQDEPQGSEEHPSRTRPSRS